jgi:anti-sigma factor ChrR (cupin superfamily)
MSPASDKHGPEHSELVLMYALQALPAKEMPALEAHISWCEECRKEMETLRPILDAFVSWPTDILRPPSALWGRLAQRVSADTGSEPFVPAPQGWVEPEWEEVAPGISCKLLATDTERDRVSMLVRLAPGVDYPPHRHASVEELHLLQGELMIDDRKLYPGDYNRAEPGTSDARVWSETGCTCVLITGTRDELR